MDFTISELHFIKKQIDSRLSWLKDEPDDPSEEEGEIKNLKSAVQKINEVLV